jgi:hypothetical protein
MDWQSFAWGAGTASLLWVVVGLFAWWRMAVACGPLAELAVGVVSAFVRR